MDSTILTRLYAISQHPKVKPLLTYLNTILVSIEPWATHLSVLASKHPLIPQSLDLRLDASTGLPKSAFQRIEQSLVHSRAGQLWSVFRRRSNWRRLIEWGIRGWPASERGRGEHDIQEINNKYEHWARWGQEKDELEKHYGRSRLIRIQQEQTCQWWQCHSCWNYVWHYWQTIFSKWNAWSYLSNCLEYMLLQ